VHLIFFRKDASNDKLIQKYLQQALELRISNGDFAAAGDTLNGLGSLAQKQNLYNVAETQFMKSLELREKVLSGCHAEIGQVNTSLGSLYHVMNDLKRARRYYVRAKDIYATALGADHPRGASALEGLAKVYQDMGDLANAKLVLAKVVKIHKNMGEDNPNYKRSSQLLNEVTSQMQSTKRSAANGPVSASAGVTRAVQ